MPTDSELKHAIILPLTNYVAASNVVFTDFHGQEEGEDPDFDEQCRKQSIYEEQLYQAIYAYVTRTNHLAALEALDRLEKEKQHGAWCIDNDCEDEDHMYWYIPLETVHQARDALKKEPKR